MAGGLPLETEASLETEVSLEPETEVFLELELEDFGGLPRGLGLELSFKAEVCFRGLEEMEVSTEMEVSPDIDELVSERAGRPSSWDWERTSLLAVLICLST